MCLHSRLVSSFNESQLCQHSSLREPRQAQRLALAWHIPAAVLWFSCWLAVQVGDLSGARAKSWCSGWPVTARPQGSLQSSYSTKIEASGVFQSEASYGPWISACPLASRYVYASEYLTMCQSLQSTSIGSGFLLRDRNGDFLNGTIYARGSAVVCGRAAST